ncbi:MAG TPA: response regulator transcription factor [Acidimicrobiia bacterium]|nr:response regulator transcription factor [Acidimicrobiia bacterium]
MGVEMIRVMIADDHQLFAEGLSQALNSLPDARVVGVVNSGPDLDQALMSQPAEVSIVDIEMPGGDGIETIAELGRRTRAIVVSMHASDEQKQRAAEAGAVGFFSKAVPLTTLASAVRAVADGKNLIKLTDEERDDLLETYREAELDPGAASLTPREREILQLLAVGVSATDELAERLYISQKTVKNHLASIFQKLAVQDRTQAAIEAIRLGIAKPN